MADDDPALIPPIAAQDEVEPQEFLRGARERWMRVNQLVQTQMDSDGGRDRRDDAVRDARRLGMDWGQIARALHLTEAEVRAQVGPADRLDEPSSGQGPRATSGRPRCVHLVGVMPAAAGAARIAARPLPGA
jgi:hypothetical protein